MYTKTVLHETVPFTYWLPGAVATLALIMLNLVRPPPTLDAALHVRAGTSM